MHRRAEFKCLLSDLKEGCQLYPWNILIFILFSFCDGIVFVLRQNGAQLQPICYLSPVCILTNDVSSHFHSHSLLQWTYCYSVNNNLFFHHSVGNSEKICRIPKSLMDRCLTAKCWNSVETLSVLLDKGRIKANLLQWLQPDGQLNTTPLSLFKIVGKKIQRKRTSGLR